MFAFDHQTESYHTNHHETVLRPSDEVIFPLNVGHQSGIDVNGKDCAHEDAQGTGAGTSLKILAQPSDT